MSRPSDGMTLDELRHEFDWIYEFQSRMAERIRGDTDVHSLVDYVTKLEAENAKLKQELEAVGTAAYLYGRTDLADENAKLRKYAKLMHDHIKKCCDACGERCICDIDALTRELGVEMSE